MKSLAAVFVLLAGLCAGQAQAACTVTNTFADQTTAFAAQVNTNFQNVIGCIPRVSSSTVPTPGNFYVNPIGNDTADCLAAATGGGHGPCLTINHALAIAQAYDAHQTNIQINLAAGTYSENVAVNGPLSGGQSNTSFISGNSIPGIAIVGAGSGSTTIAGGQVVNSQSFCYAVLANADAYVTLSGVTLTANAGGSSCSQSAEYAQFHGKIVNVADVKIGATNGFGVFAEENGVILVAPGCGGCNTALTFANSGAFGAIGLSASSIFQSDSTVQFSGTPNYTGEVFDIEGNSVIKLFGNTPTAGSFTGTLFQMDSNSTLLTFFAESWPGLFGFAGQGGVWKGAPAVTVAASSGLGSTGTATVTANSDPYRGTVTLNPSGVAPAALGSVSLTLPYALSSGACAAPSFTNVGTGSFQLGTILYYTITGGGNALNIFFANGGSTALTAGQTYPISWNCR